MDFPNALFQAVQRHPLAQQAGNALKSFQERCEAIESDARLPPRVVALPRAGAFAAIIPGDSAVEMVLTSGINSFLNLYNTALIARLVLTWFPNPPEVIVSPLATVCDPYLNLFRGLIPPLGGSLDFSPILAFVVLNLFTNTAAALPSELPGRSAARPGAPSTSASPFAQLAAATEASRWAMVSKSQALYARRVAAAKGWAARGSAAATQTA